MGLFYFHEQPFAVYGFEPLWPHAVDNSFPSDHVALGGALATAVLFLNRPLGLFLWLLVLAIGLLRVIAGLHYPVDIVGGAVAGILAGILSYAVACWRR
jgi:membrane-associated phospholipid phosphatase